ncbi:hypothetical protein [Afifella aestuarii]|uniref:hypothetical protein n=1 Tax=Afifella aestuarii TaxID=1909496 RepID=UPI000FE35DF4|nr:hypothetical protein [Afifella aestuarii]
MGLTACGGSKILPVAEAPILEPAPAELASHCADPVTLPGRGLTQAEVEKLWARDRFALTGCGLTKQAVVDFYVRRDAALTSPGR